MDQPIKLEFIFPQALAANVMGGLARGDSTFARRQILKYAFRLSVELLRSQSQHFSQESVPAPNCRGARINTERCPNNPPLR